jgi:hypothetical protein
MWGSGVLCRYTGSSDTEPDYGAIRWEPAP